MSKVPFIKPLLPDPDFLADDLRHIYKNNYYTNDGPIYKKFKSDIENYLGQGIGVAVVSNATLGLMLAIEACMGGAEKNRKLVAVPSFTFSAGPLAIEWCGYEPIFFDIEQDSTQPSLQSFHSLLKKYRHELAGVLLTNSFGIGNDKIKQWEDLLDREKLPFIIDSAPGFGSTYANGDLIGGQGACEIFSLHVTKPFGIGEGGLITSKDPALIERLESLKNFGFDSSKQTISRGLNAKITEFDCAIGLRLLEGYSQTLADRRASYMLFETNLEGLVEFLPRAETAAIQFVSIMVDVNLRPAVMSALERAEIECRTYYAPAVHTFPHFADAKKTDMTNTDIVSQKIISLPLHPRMEEKLIIHICDVIKGALASAKAVL